MTHQISFIIQNKFDQIRHFILQIEFKVMFEACIAAIELQSYETLKEIMLKFPFILQIYRSLEQKEFQDIVKNFTYSQINKNETFKIDYKSLYLFFDAGSINKRGKQLKTEGIIRIKLKNKTDFSKNGQKNQQIKQSILYEIREYDCYEDINGYIANSRLSDNYYFPFLNKSTLILYCPFDKLSEHTFLRLKDIHNQKLRYLYSFPIFKNVQRDIFEENLYKFKFGYLYFGSTRPISKYQQSVFVKVGSLEVSSYSKTFLSHQVQGKSIVRYYENLDIFIKGNSENAVFYFIKQTQLQHIISFAKFPLGTSKQKLPQFMNYSNHQQDRQVQNSPQMPVYRGYSSVKRRKNHRSHGQMALVLKQQKKINLKKHFSNFYNEIFQQFSQKKIKQMGMNVNSDQKLILYQIKMLQRKLPDMQQINRKLHKMRQQRIKKCKLTMSSTSHLKQLKNIGVSIL